MEAATECVLHCIKCMHFEVSPSMPHRRLHVVADDLSGAAECAAALARASRGPVPLVLGGDPPAGESWALDTDSRALPAHGAGDAGARALRMASAGSAAAVAFKKIDSTLRGHLAAELRAALADPGLAQAAVVCPTLPSQGRALQGGVLHVRGQAQRDADGHPLDLMKLLAAADLHARLLCPPEGASAAGLAEELVAAVQGGARVVVVDAADHQDLRRLAQALLLAPGSARWLAVGAAGFAQALADELHAGEPGATTPAAFALRDGPVITVVGSFNPVSARQVDELAGEPGVHLVRPEARQWLGNCGVVADQIATARERAGQGHNIVLAVSGLMPLRSSRELVQCMASAAEPLIRSASTLVMTGGDTARTVLDRLGVERLQVLGELEPGICLSRTCADLPAIVTKAGGFGDSQSLVRVLRHLRKTSAHHQTSTQRNE
jgi:uncharacterized protein YgbK (DUF1537 family)